MKLVADADPASFRCDSVGVPVKTFSLINGCK
jgi:hypothetical protein